MWPDIIEVPTLPKSALLIGTIMLYLMSVKIGEQKKSDGFFKIMAHPLKIRKLSLISC
jgi:hypothetical protein